MKIALEYSGLMRNFRDNYQNHLDNIIKVYDPDIFIYTLGGDVDSIKQLYGDSLKKIVSIETDYKPTTPIYKGLNREKYLKDILSRENTGRAANHIRQLYKISKCHEMVKQYEVENSVKYDVYIRCRTDIMFNKPIDIPNIQENEIYLFGGIVDGCRVINDTFAMSRDTGMSVYSTCYEEFGKYYTSSRTEYNRTCGLSPEGQLHQHFDKNDISIKTFPSDFGYKIDRKEKTWKFFRETFT